MNNKIWLGVCVLLVWGSAAWAEDIHSGDWVWNVDDPESYHAGTQNAAGQVLMQMCDPADGTCFYAVGFDTSCDEGDSYPALVNSDAGTAGIELLCGGEVDGGSNVMLVKDFEQVDNIIREATRIGFALPMKGDEFKAVRFSLKGSVNAIEAMRKVAALGAPTEKNTKKVKDTEVF